MRTLFALLTALFIITLALCRPHTCEGKEKFKYPAYACDKGDRIQIIMASGKEFLLPDDVDNIWMLGEFKYDYIGYYRVCNYHTDYVLYFHTDKRIEVRQSWYEPSYYQGYDC